MRVFIAVTLNDQVKSQLESAQQLFLLKRQRGNFTAYENFHLTLVFIGEVRSEEIIDLGELLDRIDERPFEVHLGEPGCFASRDGAVWFIGIAPEPRLAALQAKIARALREAGFAFDDKRYVPHLTLVRNYRPKPTEEPLILPPVPPLTIPVRRLSLMESARINSQLIYTEIYGKDL